MNSRLIYILLVNLVVLGVNAWLFIKPSPFTFNTENAVESHQVTQPDVIVEKSEQEIKVVKEDIAASKKVITENTLLTKSKIAAQKEIDILKEQLQTTRAKLAVIEQDQEQQKTQLITLSKNNERLVDTVSTLDNQVNIQESYLAESLKREQALNETLQKQRLQQASLLSSPINRIKTSIDQQPDLLRTKKGSSIVNDAISDAEFVDVAIQNNAIKTDVVDSNEENNDVIEPLTGALEFGFNFEENNESIKSTKSRLILDYDIVDTYNINSDVQFEYRNEDDEDTKNKFRWQLQGNYNLDPTNLVFLRSDIHRTKFASYEREDTFTTGFGHIFFNQNNHKFNTELGPGYKFAVPNDGEDEVSINEFILRTKLNYERIVTENLQVTLEGVLELGKANSAYETEFRAQNRIYQELYLIFDINYKYNQNVPEDNVNEEISTGFNLQYAF